MKRTILILTLLFLLIIGFLTLTPFIFKKKIEALALQKVNESLEAVVGYNDFALSLLRTFPDFKASFTDLTLKGKHNFANDTLIHLGTLSAIIDLKSVIKGDEILIKKIKIGQSKIRLLVNAENQANWNITKNIEVQNETALTNKTSREKEEKPLSFLLDKIEVAGLDFIYDDQAAHIYFDALQVDGTVNGTMQGSSTQLGAELHARSVSYALDSIKYLSGLSIGLNTKLDANFDDWRFTFLTDQTKLNGIPVDVNGSVRLPDDSIVFAIDFSVPKLTFAEMLALIPNDYLSYTKGIDATGNIDCEGSIKGAMTGNQYPAIDIQMGLKNGIVQYEGLPEKVLVETADLQVSLPEGPLEGLELKLEKLNASIANHPFSLSTKAKNLFGDMQIDASFQGKIDLARLPEALPLTIPEIKGLLTSNLTVSGKISDLEQNRFDRFISKGQVNISQLFLEHESLPGALSVSQALIALNNESLTISGFEGKIGNSDFLLTGKIENPLKYFLLHSELNGYFELNSRYLDLNAFTQTPGDKNDQSGTAQTKEKADSVSVGEQKGQELPKNVNLTFVSKIGQLQFNQLDIRNFVGTIRLNKQQLTLEGTKMELLKGSLSLEGSVLADGRAQPDAELKLNIKDFDLPQSFQQLEVVKKYLPIARNGQGRFSSVLTLKSAIGKDWKVLFEALTASGNLSTRDIRLERPQAIDQLQSLIQTQKIKDLSVKDFAAGFSIRDGNLVISPFKTELAQQPVTLGGTFNLAGKIDLRIDATLNRDMWAPGIEQLVSFIPGHQRVTKVDVGIDLKGDAKKPEVNFDKELITKQVINQVKSSSPKEMEDAAKKLINRFLK